MVLRPVADSVYRFRERRVLFDARLGDLVVRAERVLVIWIARWLRETSNLCRALGLLAVGGGWHDRSYGLTGTGQSTALEALRARATGPRPIPWP